MACLICLAIWNQKRTKQQGFEYFNQFNRATIDGVIQTIETAHMGVLFTLEDNPMEYIFYPHTDEELNGSRIFEYTAEKGDRIIKLPYSDTLTLIKENNMLKYTFYKFKTDE